MEPKEFLSLVEPTVRFLFDAVHTSRKGIDERGQAVMDKFWPKDGLLTFTLVSNTRTGEEYIEDTNFGELNRGILLLDAAESAAAGAIFQVGYTGIAMRWSDEDRYKRGREIGTQHLSDIIIAARNQNAHMDEGIDMRPRTLASFRLLESEFDLSLNQIHVTPKSLAYQVLMVLKWDDYTDFERDMTELLSG